MNDFACEHLAHENPEVAFVHMYPGFVKTNQINFADGFFLKKALKVLAFLATPFAVDVEESGERTLFNGTAECFGPGRSRGGWDKELAIGSDETKGSGAYILKWDGSVVGKQGVLKPMREKGMGEKIWKHTLEMFERVEGMA